MSILGVSYKNVEEGARWWEKEDLPPLGVRHMIIALPINLLKSSLLKTHFVTLLSFCSCSKRQVFPSFFNNSGWWNPPGAKTSSSPRVFVFCITMLVFVTVYLCIRWNRPGAVWLQFPRPSLLFMCICIWYLSVCIFHCVFVYLVESLWCCLITISPPFSCILVYLHLVSQCLYFSLCFCVFGGIILYCGLQVPHPPPTPRGRHTSSCLPQVDHVEQKQKMRTKKNKKQKHNVRHFI